MTRKIILLLSLIVMIGMVNACSKSKKETTANLTEKKVQLEKLKKDKADIDAKIMILQADIAKLDTVGGSTNARLVGVQPVTTQSFHHYIDLQGKVDAQNISYISPRMGPSQVKAVYVRAGQYVKKGQLLLKLDDAIVRQQVVASRQQMEGIRTQLALARSLYDRQNNLWKQGIGTEVQLITARTNVHSLENQLKSMSEGVKVAQEQLKTSNVYSDVSGVADVVNIRVGEIFSGMGGNGQPQIKIVNTNDLKVVANVPENYVSRISKGTPVVITVPDLGRNITSTISLISQSIDATQRGFIAEANIKADAALKPNQSVVMKIEDYSKENALVIPVNVVQSDENNKYVYVMEKTSNGKMVAKKKIINLGEVYENLVEVKTGLSANDMLITEGYQSIYEGQVVTTAVAQ